MRCECEPESRMTDDAGSGSTSPGVVFCGAGSGRAMSEAKRPTINWMDLLWLLFLAGLALLAASEGVSQATHPAGVRSGSALRRVAGGAIAGAGPAYVVLIKIGLATCW